MSRHNRHRKSGRKAQHTSTAAAAPPTQAQSLINN